MREAIVRGLDGPGLSPLDVYPTSWQHVEGLQPELEHRQRKLAKLQVREQPSPLNNRDGLCKESQQPSTWNQSCEHELTLTPQAQACSA